MKSYGLKEYIDAGCNEMNGAMLGVHQVTQGKVCDTGCAMFDEGNCPAYKALIRTEANNMCDEAVRELKKETVRQEARRRQLSISEVRRQRRTK